MTLAAQVQDFQEHARRSLQGGQAGQALELLTQARELDSTSATTLMLQAIAMSNLRQTALATETFVQALALDPLDAKIRYNFAVHLYSFGFRAEALKAVQEGLSANPEHAGSIELLRRLQGDPATGNPTYRDAGVMAIPRGGYDQDPDLHTMPFMRTIAPFWTGVGWLLSALSVVVTILGVGLVLKGTGPGGFQETFASASATPFKFMYWICLLGSIFYGVVDLLDRRGQFAWLIPLVILPGLTLGWLALPLYLLSRKR